MGLPPTESGFQGTRVILAFLRLQAGRPPCTARLQSGRGGTDLNVAPAHVAGGRHHKERTKALPADNERLPSVRSALDGFSGPLGPGSVLDPRAGHART